jgi:hypothetical protein
MRLPLLLALLACTATASAAERESITLSDGRTLVGFYDDQTGVLTLDGKGKAVVALRPEQVKAREPAPAAKAAALAAPAPTTDAKPAAEPNPAADLVSTSAKAFADENDRHDRVVADLTRQRHDAAVAWLAKANLDDITVHALPADPRESDHQAHDIGVRFNQHLVQLRALREQSKRDERLAGNAVDVLQEMAEDGTIALMRGR